MKLTSTESKKLEIETWIRVFAKKTSKVLVSNYCYHCSFTGLPVAKTLIVFPDQLESEGILTINKPLIEVEVSDVIKLFEKGRIK